MKEDYTIGSWELPIIIAFSSVSFILGYLAMNFDRGRHPLLQIFFTVFSVLFIVVDVFAVEVILEINGITQLKPLMDNLLTVLIYGGLVFFMFYIGLTYAITYLRKKLSQRQNERDGNFGEGGLSK